MPRFDGQEAYLPNRQSLNAPSQPTIQAPARLPGLSTSGYLIHALLQVSASAHRALRQIRSPVSYRYGDLIHFLRCELAPHRGQPQAAIAFLAGYCSMIIDKGRRSGCDSGQEAKWSLVTGSVMA